MPQRRAPLARHAALRPGVYIALQLAWPVFNLGLEWTTFGRLRPVHTTAVDDDYAQGFCEPFRSLPRAELAMTMAHIVVRRRS